MEHDTLCGAKEDCTRPPDRDCRRQIRRWFSHYSLEKSLLGPALGDEPGVGEWRVGDACGMRVGCVLADTTVQ